MQQLKGKRVDHLQFVLFIQICEIGSRTLSETDHELWMDNSFILQKKTVHRFYFVIKENNVICFSTKKRQNIFKNRGYKEETCKRGRENFPCLKRAVGSNLWKTSNSHSMKTKKLSTLIDTIKNFIAKRWMKTHSNQRFLVRVLLTEFFRRMKPFETWGEGWHPGGWGLFSEFYSFIL